MWRRQVAVTSTDALRVRGCWSDHASQRFDGVGQHENKTLEVHERSIATGVGRRGSGRRIGFKRGSARSPISNFRVAVIDVI